MDELTLKTSKSFPTQTIVIVGGGAGRLELAIKLGRCLHQPIPHASTGCVWEAKNDIVHAGE